MSQRSSMSQRYAWLHCHHRPQRSKSRYRYKRSSHGLVHDDLWSWHVVDRTSCCETRPRSKGLDRVGSTVGLDAKVVVFNVPACGEVDDAVGEDLCGLPHHVDHSHPLLSQLPGDSGNDVGVLYVGIDCKDGACQSADLVSTCCGMVALSGPEYCPLCMSTLSTSPGST